MPCTSPSLRAIGQFGEAVRVLEAGAMADAGQRRAETENEMAINYSGMRRQHLLTRDCATGRDTKHGAPNVGDRNYQPSLFKTDRGGRRRS